MVPVVIAGIALTETAVVALKAAILTASALVVSNALHEKLKEAENERKNTSDAVPSAKTSCPYDKRIKELDKKITEGENELGKVKKRIDEVDKNLEDLRKEKKILEEKIEEEAAGNFSNNEKNRESWRYSRKEQIEKERNNLIDEKGKLNKEFRDIKEKNTQTLSEKNHIEAVKMKEHASTQSPPKSTSTKNTDSGDVNRMRQIERNADGSIKNIK
ncbi:hypothetical protein AAE02nite_18460 [Adhaeribacter aerolatus]|uniref:Uncharacterized protein n=1 Tax=Adhaeribacter aerolatus TaxID=670289 RepID=A0A512AWT6_9BACT|nr:hypothetical protein [Adhaeribacter aerolatus]GEO04182.1 hypothetical protein AAE02nite_18460 [Adhaeribacter aerolatus]